MAEIIFRGTNIVLPDGSSIKESCQVVGIDFGCRNGFCRTCEISVLDGYENMSPLTENEKFIRLKPPKRLACQCTILHGTVKIDKEDLF